MGEQTAASATQLAKAAEAAGAAPDLAVDFRQALWPQGGDAGVYYPTIQPPQAALDPQRGLALPLPAGAGAVAFAARDRVEDDAGSLEVEFALEQTPGDWTLVQAMGQYGGLVVLQHDALTVHIYGKQLRLLMSWQAKTLYHLHLSWEHSSGVILEIRAENGPTQRLVRRMSWQAYHQKYLPVSVGGMLGGRPVYTQWSGSFRGWIRQVRFWRAPQQALPVSVSVAADPARAAAALAAHADVRILDMSDRPLVDSPCRGRSIPDRLDDLRQTRVVGKLDALLAQCRDELEVFATLIHHVGHLWPHTHYWPWPQGVQRDIFWRRGQEMLPAIEQGEMGGMCGGYAHVMEEVFWSLGLDARRIQVYGHSSFEAYSNQYDKWMICDASFNDECHYFIDAAGVPLGAGELLRRHERLAQDPTALADVRPVVCLGQGRTEIRPSNHWAANYTMLGVGFGDPNANFGARPHRYYLSEQERATFPACSGMADATLVDRVEDLCWSCNRARVTLSWQRPGKVVAVLSEFFQVTFPEGFQKQVDGGGWEAASASFLWELHGGVNQLAVRARNQLGASGHPWSIQLWRRPA